MVEICTIVRLLASSTAENFGSFAFEIGFRTLVYRQHGTRETLTLTVTVIRNPNLNTNPKTLR